MTEPTRPCGTCGMPCTPGEYHPYAACLMFKACHDSATVRANLEAVRATPPAVAGEPVAWRYRMKGDLQWQYTERPEQFAHADEVQPLTTPQPTQAQAGAVPLTDEQIKALTQARSTAMRMAAEGRIPECGDFSAIAQNLDWLCDSFGIKGGQHGADT